MAATLWLTGLSAAGKTTLADATAAALRRRGTACCVLDGDRLRQGLNRDLGFGAAARTENVRRVAEVARLMNEAGLTVLTALISPFRAHRELARDLIGAPRFLEVHVSTPLAVCEARDPKGLYRLARAGGLPEFTGLSAPYEAPPEPALAIDTSTTSVAQAVERLISLL